MKTQDSLERAHPRKSEVLFDGLDDGSPRHCAFCGHPAVLQSDSAEERVYACPICEAWEKIAKGRKTDTGYVAAWYFGWRHSDGRRALVPESFTDRRYTIVGGSK